MTTAANRKLSHNARVEMAGWLNEAIKEVGSSQEVARILGIRVAAISQWEKCPAGRAMALEKACGKTVTRYQLRPDIFGDGTDV